MSRLPIRVRLALAFALAMALVLAGIGAFLYRRLASSLDESIEESLQARAADLVPSVAQDDPSLLASIRAGTIDADERFVQVLDPRSQIVVGTPQLGDELLLPDPSALARVRAQGRLRFELDEVPGVAGRARLLAVTVENPSGMRVLIVGTSLEDRDETLQAFVVVLAIVGPAALLLVSLLGYGLATAALRPVESMRRQASIISASEPGQRLPLPSSRDEVYRLGETLNEMLGRLESALERERSFVADASHELRTPLALLKTELELALRRPRSEVRLEQALRSAAAEADRLVQLAEDLLVLARSDRAQLALRPEPLSAREVLTRVAERFAHRAADDHRVVDVDAPPGLWLVADEVRLEQALGNLLENAFHHASGAVRLSATEQDGRLEFHVRDEGSGFPPAFLPHAFDRFSRADDARSGAGAGLGLTIAQAIAHAHGGSAHAENGPGGGADVWLSIPKRS